MWLDEADFLCSSIACIMYDDIDDKHKKNIAYQYSSDFGDEDDASIDDLLQNCSIMDVLHADDHSLGTLPRNSPALPLSDINTDFYDPTDSSRDRDVYILPYPLQFVREVRESAAPSISLQVPNFALANVLYDSFPQLLPQPGSNDEILLQFLTYIRGQRQLSSQATTPNALFLDHCPLMCAKEPPDSVTPSTKKKRGEKAKDPKKHRMKNRPFGLKYKTKPKHEKGNKMKKAQSQKKENSWKRDDVRTSIICWV